MTSELPTQFFIIRTSQTAKKNKYKDIWEDATLTLGGFHGDWNGFVCLLRGGKPEKERKTLEATYGRRPKWIPDLIGRRRTFSPLRHDCPISCHGDGSYLACLIKWNKCVVI